jgi:hypothetical protein
VGHHGDGLHNIVAVCDPKGNVQYLRDTIREAPGPAEEVARVLREMGTEPVLVRLFKTEDNAHHAAPPLGTPSQTAEAPEEPGSDTLAPVLDASSRPRGD